MQKYEKKKNIVVGLIIYLWMMVIYIISICRLIPTLVRGWANSFAIATLVADIIILLLAITALVIMLVRKRQSGFGLALPMAATLIAEVCYLIALMVEKSRSYYSYGLSRLQTMDILTFFMIIPIVLIIIYFFVPNLVTRILAAVGTGLTIIVAIVGDIIGIVRMLSWSVGSYVLFSVISMLMTVVLYSLVMIQIFLSFKATNAPANQAPVYAQAQNFAYTQPQTSAYAQPQASAQAPTMVKKIPNEQVLENFRKLLDQGIISQEQYDAKVKELSE